MEVLRLKRKLKLWIKLFENDNKFYCYDVNTNSIMEIDEPLYLVLNELNQSDVKIAVKNLSSLFGEKKTNKLLCEVKKYNDLEKFFFSKSKKKIKLEFPFNKTEYKKILNNLLNHMIINLTDKCNFNCAYCRFSDVNQENNTLKETISQSISIMAIDFFIKNANYIIDKTNKDLILGFYGGEPLIELDLLEYILKYIEEKYRKIFNRFRFSMTTNGSLLNERAIDVLIKYNFQLLLSLDGPKDIHDRHRVYHSGKGTFNNIKNNLELIKSRDKEYFEKKVGFSIVLAPEFKLHEVLRFFKSNNYSNNRVYMFSDVELEGTKLKDKYNMELEWNKHFTQQMDLKNEYLKKKISGVDDLLLRNIFGSNVSDIHFRTPRKMTVNNYPNGICLPGLQKVFVDTKGNFQLCEKINRYWDIGNMKDGFDINKIYNLIEKYIHISNEKCQDCWAIRLCKECYLSAIDENVFSTSKKNDNCERKRLNVLQGLKDYTYIIERNQNAFSEERNEDGIMYEAYKFLGRI